MKPSYDEIKKEYEEFAYIVSHDLNAPLRHLKQFSELLINDREQQISEDEKLYLYFMKKSLRQLSDMQDALLTFSRITTQNSGREEINTDTLVAEVISDKKMEYDGVNIVFSCDALPHVSGDKSLIRAVFEAVIDNAIKFHEHGSNDERECRISVRDRDDHILFQIKDNGIGIKHQYHEEVFKIFRCLNAEEDYPGIGAGLAYARKIINKHSGQIWIDSEPGEGATVYFTLPK